MGAKKISPLGPAAAMENKMSTSIKLSLIKQPIRNTHENQASNKFSKNAFVFPKQKPQAKEGVCNLTHTHTSATSRERNLGNKGIPT